MIFTTRKISNRLQLNNVYKNLSVRHLSLLECRSKEILQKFDVNIQKFRVVNNAADAAQVPDILKAKEYVIKAQVHAGGRGLGHFNKPMHMISPNLYGNIGNNFGRRFISTNSKVNKKSVPMKVKESVEVEKEVKMRNWIIVDNTENSKLRQLQRSSLILSLRQYCYVNVRWLHVKPTSRVFNEQMTVDFQEEPERDELNLNFEEIEEVLHEQNREKENASYQRGFNDACMFLLPELKVHALKIDILRKEVSKIKSPAAAKSKIEFYERENGLSHYDLTEDEKKIIMKISDLKERKIKAVEFKWLFLLSAKNPNFKLQMNQDLLRIFHEKGISIDRACRAIAVTFEYTASRWHELFDMNGEPIVVLKVEEYDVIQCFF